MESLKYYAAACRTDQPNPLHHSEMKRNTAHIQMIDQAVVGYAPFLPVKLIVFPEFAYAAPVYLTAKELRKKLAVAIPNEHTERIQGKAQEYGLYVLSQLEQQIDFVKRRVGCLGIDEEADSPGIQTLLRRPKGGL